MVELATQVKLGVAIDDPNVAESVERALRSAEATIYERVAGR